MQFYVFVQLPAYVAGNDSNVVELVHAGSLYCASKN